MLLMKLPQHVQTALGVASSISEEDLAVHETVGQFARSTFGLSGAEFARAIAAASLGIILYSVLPAKRGPLLRKYIEIVLADEVECSGVCTPESVVDLLSTPESQPPTAASLVLVGAWLSDETILEGNNVAARKVVRAFKAKSGARNFPLRLFNEWANACPLLDGCAVPPTWITKSQIQVTSGSRIEASQVSGSRFQDLFIEAASEVKTKWRYGWGRPTLTIR